MIAKKPATGGKSGITVEIPGLDDLHIKTILSHFTVRSRAEGSSHQEWENV